MSDDPLVERRQFVASQLEQALSIRDRAVEMIKELTQELAELDEVVSGQIIQEAETFLQDNPEKPLCRCNHPLTTHNPDGHCRRECGCNKLRPRNESS